MLPVIIGLMVLAALALIVGFVLVMRRAGVKRREVSKEEAASILSGGDAPEDTSSTISLVEKERSVFRGRAVGVSGEASISLSEVGAALRSGRLAEIAPWLLAMGGLAALLLLVAPLLWLTVSPVAGVVWFAALFITAMQAYRNRNKAD